MKKILSLLIIMIMIFSMQNVNIFAASSYEAELLSDLSIMQGDLSGNMRYGEKVSRAECAKIVVAASKYRDFVDASNKRSAFSDVTSDHWAAPFVTVGVKNGLFKGYFDATFRPANTVTYEEAIAMLLRVLDYTEEDIGNDWPYDQINMGKKVGILDGITKTTGQELTRRDISRMVYNTLNAKAKGSQEIYLTSFNKTVGPVTVASSNWYEELGADETVKVIKDGKESSIFEVTTNDIAYFMVEYNKIFVYSKKITGIYENASPNKDMPVSITVSGVTYNIEGDDAYLKLSSGGNINYGDTVTLLLGKSGDVAGVATSLSDDTKFIAFLTATGTKETTVSGTKITKPYIRVIRPSGEAYEFITEKNYESYLNRVVTVKLKDSLATVTSVSQNHNVSGKVVWESGVGLIGSYTLSSDVKIIETSTTEAYETATVGLVYPQRLNGMKISENDILYVSKNDTGNINEIILKDVTGDMHTYGIVLSAKVSGNDNRITGTYKYIVDGIETSLTTNNQTFGISAGQAVKIKTSGREISSMTSLSQVQSKQISSVNGSVITMDNNKYIMSDKVQIYVKTAYTNPYTLITIDELNELIDEYRASVYTDKATSSGGRVRVIILYKN